MGVLQKCFKENNHVYVFVRSISYVYRLISIDLTSRNTCLGERGYLTLKHIKLMTHGNFESGLHRLIDGLFTGFSNGQDEGLFQSNFSTN